MTSITLPRATVEQALEALEWHYRQGHSNTLGGFRLKIDEKALRVIRAALAQQVEPTLTIERLRDALVASRIIPPEAVEDPDEYDDGVTLHRIEALHRRIA